MILFGEEELLFEDDEDLEGFIIIFLVVFIVRILLRVFIGRGVLFFIDDDMFVFLLIIYWIFDYVEKIVKFFVY